MKTIFKILLLSMSFTLFGCGDESESIDHNEKQEIRETQEKQEETSKENEAEGEEMTKEKKDLTLQVMKVDEDEGVTIENNEFYQALLEVVESDPKMGEQNDVSLFPYSVMETADGGNSILFLVINRLDRPIRNFVFNLTFGNQDGEYIYDQMEVDLPEETMGILEKDGVIPILLEIDDADIEMFLSLEQEDMFLQLDDVGIDFKE